MSSHPITTTGTISSAFESFRELLDEHYDRRERLIKVHHPAALAFVQAPKPFPSSFARDTYFGVTAFAFTNAVGQKRFGRYRIVPEQGNDFLSDEAVAKLSPNYHFDEIAARVRKEPARFRILVQVAEDGDIPDDATHHWPEERGLVDLGTIELTATVPDDLAQQKHIIFDPIPRVDGIESSGDPLLDPRASLYLMSGRRRRKEGSL